MLRAAFCARRLKREVPAMRKMLRFKLAAAVRLYRLLERLGITLPAGVFYIGGSETLPPPMSREEEARYIQLLRRDSHEAKQALIERNLRLVVYIARRFENTGINIEDLISIGTIGLIKAINTYDADKNIKLATYASRCIENEILMFLRKTSNRRSEVSFDEPLNTDWDGNELLLSDILGTDSDMVMRPMEDDVDRKLLLDAVDRSPSASGRSSSCASGAAGSRSARRRRSPTSWASRSRISAASKSGSSSASAARLPAKYETAKECAARQAAFVL
jgi:RNA polymerase sporulation-specific sigma factor